MLSIVVPTIGRSNSIIKSIESAVKISDLIVKQIIIFDNSQNRDFLRTITKKIECLQDNRIIIRSNDARLTMAESWNTAMKYVDQQWLLYLHDDDELYSENFNKVAQYLSSDYAYICFDYDVFDMKRNKIIKKRRKKKRSDGLSVIYDCPKFVSTIINTKVFKEFMHWDNKYGYFLDFVLFFCVAKKYDVLFVNDVIGKYVLHCSNLSSVEKRSASYGDAIPEVISTLYNYSNDDNERKEVLYVLRKYVYDAYAKSLYGKAINRIIEFLESLKLRL